MQPQRLSAPGHPNYCHLTYDADRHWLRVSWQGFVGPEQAREGALAGLRMLRQLQCAYLLNDNSQLEGPWFDSLFWLSNEWGPAAAQAGLRFVAHVAQARSLATAFTPTAAHQLFQQFEIQVFEEPAEAMEWLSSCQSSADEGAARQSA